MTTVAGAAGGPEAEVRSSLLPPFLPVVFVSRRECPFYDVSRNDHLLAAQKSPPRSIPSSSASFFARVGIASRASPNLHFSMRRRGQVVFHNFLISL